VTMRLVGVLLASNLLLTGCGSQESSACQELNRQWNDTLVLLSELPNTFDDMTQDEGFRWATAREQKDAVEARMEALDCEIVPR
jgi:hypothetical protein